MNEHKKKLEEEKKTLMGQLKGLGQHDPETKEWEATAQAATTENADMNSTADRFEDFEEKSALIVPLQARLTQVNEALERIEKGTYGKCRVCGNAIEDARLSANPAAETCMQHLEE